MKFFLATAIVAFSSLGYAQQNTPLMSCHEQSSVGPATEAPHRLLNIVTTDTGKILATLSSESLEGRRILAEMTCDHNRSRVIASQGRQEIVVESPAAMILAHPSVAELLVDAGRAQRSLFIKRIVIGEDVANKQPFCIELKWFGGDVVGTFGSIRGNIVRQSLGGRGGMVSEVEDAALNITSPARPGYPACD